MPVEVVPTYINILRVWWAYTWRWLACVPVVFIVLFVFQFFAQALQTDAEFLKSLLRGLSFIIGILMSQWVLHRLLTKGFGRYRLAMVEK